MRFIAYSYYTWIRIGYPTRIVFFLTNIINYIFFCVFFVSARSVHWTYYVYLIVFELSVPFIQVEYMICIVYSEYAVGCVPVDIKRLGVVPHHAFDEENED